MRAEWRVRADVFHICFRPAVGKELEASRGQCAFGLCDLA